MMRVITAIGFLMLMALVVILVMRGRSPEFVQGEETAIAVLPFSSLADGGETYLSTALADELVTLLSRSPLLAVRPFAQSRGVSGTDDLTRAARELHAELLLTGQYDTRADHLEIRLEVTDTRTSTVVWSDRLSVARDDPLSWNEALSGWVNTTLLPALEIEPMSGPSIPADAEAYELYLRSLALAEDPGREHERAKRMLERSVALDPGYAPAWDAFARRLYFDSQTTGAGGDRAFRRAEAAQQRALDLDPDLIEAATGLTNMRTERGELRDAYTAAEAKVRELPRNALTHFSLSYVLRYMGHLDDSLRECEVAYGLDPQIRLRSCALPYAQAGNYRRAYDFLELDAGSDWVANKRAAILLREGRREEALTIWKELPPEYAGADFWATCLEGEDARVLEELSGRAETETMAAFDPEVKYWDGALQGVCGQYEAALRLLETAVDQNYCSYPAMDTDPLWEPLRDDAEFKRIREKAIACHESFGVLR